MVVVVVVAAAVVDSSTKAVVERLPVTMGLQPPTVSRTAAVDEWRLPTCPADSRYWRCCRCLL